MTGPILVSLVHMNGYEQEKEMEEKFMQIDEVEEVVSLKKTKIYSLIKEQKFPPGVLLGRRARRWPASQVQGWITKQIGGAA